MKQQIIIRLIVKFLQQCLRDQALEVTLKGDGWETHMTVQKEKVEQWIEFVQEMGDDVNELLAD